MKTNKKNIIIVLLFIILPYIWFGKELFIGGDDTRLYLSYPIEWLQNLVFNSSWLNFSALGTYNPQFFIIPLLSFLGIFEILNIPSFVVQNLSLSIIFILGFFYIYKFFNLITNNKFIYESFIASLFFIFSPILYINQFSNFLYSVWLVGLIPISLYFITKYLRHGDISDLFKYFLFSLFLSLGFYSIPWLLAFLLPLFFSGFYIFLFKKNKYKIIKRLLILIIIIILGQSFWLIPFIMQFFNSASYLSGEVLSESTANTFLTTVKAVSYGNNIFYPLLNLFHYNIQKNFSWQSLKIYDIFYMKLLIFDFIYIIIFILGFIYKNNAKKYKNIYLGFLLGFLLILFFFTVRIGIFTKLFYSFGNIPGFVMFRNFFDKFALGFIIFYSIILFFSLIFIKKSIKKDSYKILKYFLLIIIFINSLPFFYGSLSKLPLWTTKNIDRNLIMNKEYIDTINYIKSNIKKGDNIIIMPFGISIYSYIIGQKENKIFAGRSPVELFTDINDFSGRLSFPSKESKYFEELLLKHDYKNIKKFFIKHNIKYILYYPRLSKDFLKSYLFDQKILKSFDEDFQKNIFGKKLYKSYNGNYELYNIKSLKSELIGVIGSNNISFIKNSDTNYLLLLNKLKNNEIVYFKDSFSTDWKLYLKNIQGLFTLPLFENTHKKVYDYANSWTISKQEIIDYVNKYYGDELKKEGYPKKLENGQLDYKYYKLNPDGSIDVELTLYFKPQLYFYIGLIISGTTFLLLILWLIIDKIKNKKALITKNKDND